MKDELPQETKKIDEERAKIGTPAGESPEKGRQRHGTQCLTGICPIGGSAEPLNAVENVEDYGEAEEEIATTGGITGTKVRGGNPPGGTQTGATQAQPRGTIGRVGGGIHRAPCM